MEGRIVPDQTTKAEELLHAVNDTARAVGSRFAGFLTVTAYVAVTVISTSDNTLVHGTKVHLPIFNVDVPMTCVFGFHTLAPWLIVLMHTDLLLQMSALSRKLRQFCQALRMLQSNAPETSDALSAAARAQFRERLASFYYVRFLSGFAAGDSRTQYALSAVVLCTAIILFPLTLLLGIQIRFLPLHSVGTTLWHQSAVIADALLICALWPTLVPYDMGAASSDGEQSRPLFEQAYRSGLLFPMPLGIAVVAVSLFVATIPQDTGKGWWFKVRNLALRNEILTAEQLSAQTVNDLRHGGAAKQQAVLDQVPALAYFQGRDLRYGDFFAAVMPKFDFRALWAEPKSFPTQLDGADFSWTQLQSALLDEAHAENTLFRGAQLQEAVLTAAHLAKATLTDAQLQHAILVGAELTDAQADGAHLQGADLSDAQLGRVNLANAQLQGANLSGAHLDGATLSGANLEGANLSRAVLNNAKLDHTKMKAVLLLEAVVHGTDFTGADADLADIRGVNNESDIQLTLDGGTKLIWCDAGQAPKCHWSDSQIPGFVRGVTQHLVDLACRDTYVARGLVDQLHYNLSVHARDQRWSALAVAFKKCLPPSIQGPCVSPSCEGLCLLDPARKDQIESDVAQLPANDKPNPAAATATPMVEVSCDPHRSEGPRPATDVPNANQSASRTGASSKPHRVSVNQRGP
jgi:uncharacterized protein YjbI with pentapeptide repeats